MLQPYYVRSQPYASGRISLGIVAVLAFLALGATVLVGFQSQTYASGLTDSSGRYGNASVLKMSLANLDEVVAQSELQWQHMVKKREIFVAQKGGWPALRMFKHKEHRQGFAVWDLFTAPFNCPWELERIGRVGDGGKLTCGLSRVQHARGQTCTIMSFGVNNDSSWEAEILQRTDCQVYMYDFSVKTYGPEIRQLSPELAARAHFFPYGLGAKDEIINGLPFFSLRTLMADSDVEWIDILKIDVEGAEFSILPAIIEEFGDGKLPFGQLLVEIHTHWTNPPYSMDVFKPFWYRIEQAGLRASAAELNYGAIKKNTPSCMEVTFLNNCNGRERCGSLLREPG